MLARAAALAGRLYVCSQAAIAPLRKLARAAAFAGRWPPRALRALAGCHRARPRRPVCSPAVGVLARAASCEVSGRRERSPAGAACDRWLPPRSRRPTTALTPAAELAFQASLVRAGSSTVSMSSLVARLRSSVQAPLLHVFTGGQQPRRKTVDSGERKKKKSTIY